MPPHLTRMGYRTTVPTNIRFIFFVASPESEGLCLVKYWLVLQQNILKNFANCEYEGNIISFILIDMRNLQNLG